ncbi:MAG: RdgB/HAM1 family non-canonical purine NTP pyrophosphatase [Deltaproteobacteria bacterium]|jgi:XTP/dITP diphosphohydrolase|nr:RdgB/HAM1 family non-canonical purine NTP pyrophosphatase [Deltaproteobacteria bacterium]
MAADRRLVVASQNQGKCREIGRLLGAFEVLSLADFAPVDFPEEGGDYRRNACEKALAAARATGLPCVADDSGLEVECLDGAPGPYSARFGGAELDDRGRVDHLLEVLRDQPKPRRARFYCVAACALPDGRTEVAEGICEGEILMQPRGEGGFGYDPVFRPSGDARTLAEHSTEEKEAISHRGRAFRTLASKLEELLASQ